MLYSNIGEQKGEGGQYFNNYLMRKKKVLYCNMVLPFEVRGEGMREDDGRRGCGMWDVGCGMWDVGCGMGGGDVGQERGGYLKAL